MLTICGGKWTTYRKMAEDCVDHAVTLARLEDNPCLTRELRIHGYHEDRKSLGSLSFYGSDAREIEQLVKENPELGEKLHKDLPFCKAEVIWAARSELARTVEDFLARRVRALFLNASAALEMAPEVAQLMAQELKKDDSWVKEQLQQFKALANQYMLKVVIS
jgi:glycerol-3-phosphate dehydrogenase